MPSEVSRANYQYVAISHNRVIMRVQILIDFYVAIFPIFVNFGYGGVVFKTKQGILKGQLEKSRGGREFYSFYGIPYAEPPVGKLRFEAPVAPKPWEGVRDCTILPPPCLQDFPLEKPCGNEDCLYLHLYKPKIEDDKKLLPVMVFVHGSRFLYQDALPDKYGANYFMDRDVILITFQYRLGTIGFLSTEDEIIPGNYGLKDIVAVLRWVQNYIDDFGGDKNRVTLIGASSGAISASMTLLSPIAKGLFHRLITQSGSPFDLEKPPGKARLNAWKLGSLVGCDGDEVDTSQELLDCLRNIPAETLVSHDDSFFNTGYLMPAFPFGPVIENEKVPGAFLVDEPAKLLKRQTDIPWINGINSDEGGEMALIAYKKAGGSGMSHVLEANYKKVFPVMFRYEHHVKDSNQQDLVTDIYTKYYFQGQNISQNIHGFAKMFTSLIYVTGLREAVRLYQGPKYVYYYNHRNKESFAKMYTNDDLHMGVIHGDELIGFYNWSSLIIPVTEGVDLKMSEQMLDLWTNFAANGHPNYENKIVWDPVDSPDINYLHIKDGTIEMKNNLLKEEYEFLDSVPVDGYF